MGFSTMKLTDLILEFKYQKKVLYLLSDTILNSGEQ